MTGDRWHMTGERWHLTSDTWHMTHIVGWTFSQNVSSLALPVWDWQCFEYISTSHEWVSQSVNYEAVYRTAPATPGLLKNLYIYKNHYNWTASMFSWDLTGQQPISVGNQQINGNSWSSNVKRRWMVMINWQPPVESQDMSNKSWQPTVER